MTPTSHSVVHGCGLSTNGAQHITMFAWIRKAVLYEIYFIIDNIWFSVVELNHLEVFIGKAPGCFSARSGNIVLCKELSPTYILQRMKSLSHSTISCTVESGVRV